MNEVLVLLFSAGSAAFLTALVAGVRSVRAPRKDLYLSLARQERTLDNLREQMYKATLSYDQLNEKHAQPIVPVIVGDPADVVTLKRPYAGKIRTSFDYVYDQEVMSTSWDIDADASEEEQAKLRQELESALRADGTGILVTDKITWSKNPSSRKNFVTIAAEIRKNK